MRIAEVLARKGRDVEVVAPGTVLRVAVDRMTAKRIGSVVVSADGRRIDGLLGEREVLEGLRRHGTTVLDRTVADLMDGAPPSCHEQDAINDVLALMTRTRSRHVPVVEQGELRGLVSIGDLVKHRLEELETEARVLREAYITSR